MADERLQAERVEEDLSPGAAYALIYWLDDNYELTTELLATRFEITEHDDEGEIISTAYGERGATGTPS